MAIIDDSVVLELERQRTRLNEILDSKGVVVSEDETLGEMIPKVDILSSESTMEDYVGGIIDGTAQEVKSSAATKIVARLFLENTNLEKVSIPNAVSADSNAFNGCTNLKHLNLKSMQKTLGDYVFYNCNSPDFKVLYLPNFDTFASGTHFLSTNMYLEKIILPRLKQIGSSSAGYSDRAFKQQQYLKLFDIDGASSAVKLDSLHLETLIIRSTTVASLNNVTDIKNGDTSGLTIYVPRALIDSYKTATNWSAFEQCFETIEGSDYEDLDWYEGTQDYRIEVLGE